jgi:hypothetical protein
LTRCSAPALTTTPRLVALVDKPNDFRFDSDNDLAAVVAGTSIALLGTPQFKRKAAEIIAIAKPCDRTRK